MEMLISVIVPVYNTEKYIRKCIDSIINQTYHNIEILLIDDGSSDNSGIICDKYAKTDNRIKVIHKENKGVADARNRGIDIAQGEILFFVDSDDWISNDCIEILYTDMVTSASDCSIAATLFVYKKDCKIRKRYNKEDISGVLSGIEAINAAFYGKNIWITTVGSLFKKELFESIRYPYGKVHEDAAIIYKLFEKSKKVTFTYKAKYYYLKRDDGNLTSIISYKKITDIINITESTVEYITNNINKCYSSAIHYLVTHQLNICLRMPLRETKYKEQYTKIKGNIKKYRLLIIYDKHADANIKICCILSYFGFGIMRFLWRIYKALLRPK